MKAFQQGEVWLPCVGHVRTNKHDASTAVVAAHTDCFLRSVPAARPVLMAHTPHISLMVHGWHNRWHHGAALRQHKCEKCAITRCVEYGSCGMWLV